MHPTVFSAFLGTACAGIVHVLKLSCRDECCLWFWSRSLKQWWVLPLPLEHWLDLRTTTLGFRRLVGTGVS